MIIRLYPFVLAAALGFTPIAVAAQSREQPTPGQEEQRAYDACGGGPIQNGHPVQPTPDRDECLARMQHQALPRNLEGPPSASAGSNRQPPELAGPPERKTPPE